MKDSKFTKQQFRLMYITQGKSVHSTKHEIIEVLKGGCRWVQIRMKEAPFREIEEVAAWALPYCLEYNTILIINDHPLIAMQANAHGVHLGKNDPSVYEARNLLGPSKIIGITANTIADVLPFVNSGIDYVGIGPFRHTQTKKNLRPILGLEGYRNIMSEMAAYQMALPWVAIGGIEETDIETLHSHNIQNLAVSSAIGNSVNIELATKRILEKWENNS
jgi:thiamine-phosphate pyrophosphorylase